MGGITATNNTGTSSDNNTTVSNTTSSSDIKSEFLTLLVTQLKNQDPLNAVDQKDMLTQLAQFSSLEQMQNLTQTLSSSNSYSALTQSASLIGKTVTTAGDTNNPGVTGIVDSIVVKGNKPYVHIGNADIDASTIVSIK